MFGSDFEEVDEVLEVMDVQEVVRNRSRKVYFSRIDPFDKYSDRHFKSRYRFSKAGVEKILTLIGNKLNEGSRGNSGLPVSPLLQLLATLCFFAKGPYQQGNAEMHGLSQATMSRVLRKVSVALANLRGDFITFPDSEADQRNEMAAFYEIKRFPKVIGCIDCTHVKIKNPGGPNAAEFINRKNFFSLNVQVSNIVVGGAKLKIKNIVSRWRGSTHDSRIFNESNLKREFESGKYKGILLGDSGYACRPYLLTPVRNPQSAAEEKYNNAHVLTRNTVERLFGVWKMTFRALHRGLTGSLDTSKAMIVAMAVLHNLRIDDRLEEPENSDDDSEDENLEENEQDSDDNDEASTGRGNIFRRSFIVKHF